MKIKELETEILLGKKGINPKELYITGAASIYQTTQFPKTNKKYENYYTLLRVESYFGACCHTKEQVHREASAEMSGISLDKGINDTRVPIKIAAMDAYLGRVFPHRECSQESVIVPAGTPEFRANFRDEFIARVANVKKDEKVALIGVVNPLVRAIQEAGGNCLPCDLEMRETSAGLPVEKDMHIVLEKADSVISTAMTLGNDTFDEICSIVQKRKIPLTIYGQTGSAVVAQFIGKGVTSLIAEPFPFTQFTCDESRIFVYKKG